MPNRKNPGESKFGLFWGIGGICLPEGKLWWGGEEEIQGRGQRKSGRWTSHVPLWKRLFQGYRAMFTIRVT